VTTWRHFPLRWNLFLFVGFIRTNGAFWVYQCHHHLF
jgi:hypothetical protein